MIRKRGRGRPKKRPPEYWSDLADLVGWALLLGPRYASAAKQNKQAYDPDLVEMIVDHVGVYELPQPQRSGGHLLWIVRHRQNIHRLCEHIANRGGVRWMRNGEVVAEITDAKTLRARLYEARKQSRNSASQSSARTTDFMIGEKLIQKRF